MKFYNGQSVNFSQSVSPQITPSKLLTPKVLYFIVDRKWSLLDGTRYKLIALSFSSEEYSIVVSKEIIRDVPPYRLTAVAESCVFESRIHKINYEEGAVIDGK